MPSAAYKSTKGQQLQVKKPYDYKGNFYDIAHLAMQNKSKGQDFHQNTAIFATQLRQYKPNKYLKQKSQRYDLVFNKKRSVMQDKYGLGFLPPINDNSAIHYTKVPHQKYQ